MFEHQSKSKNGFNHALSDLNVLQNIDSQDDPMGYEALKKINFHNKGMAFTRKEYNSPKDAIMALEVSKSRVTEMMNQARAQHMNQFKNAVGKVIKEDHLVSTMPRIRVSAAKSLVQRTNTLAMSGQRNMFGDMPTGQQSTRNQGVIGGLTSGNLQ